MLLHRLVLRRAALLACVCTALEALKPRACCAALLLLLLLPCC